MSLRFAEAAVFAAEAHAGQMRKGGAAPYINHPLAVAHAVAVAGGDEDALCAALLHDVVEDTDVTLDAVRTAFGARVAGIVAEVTDPPDWGVLPTAERKRRQAGKMARASAEARLVKIADQLSNVTDLAKMNTGGSPDSLAAYLAAARSVVDACRAAAPGLAAGFDAAAQALERRIADHV